MLIIKKMVFSRRCRYNHPEIKKAAAEALEKWGYGLASVRFICGTQKIHKELEKKPGGIKTIEVETIQ